MEIPKDHVVQMVRDHGALDEATHADQQLPDRVDPHKHGDLLLRLGVVAVETLEEREGRP
jgi:hypothetical protein